MFGMFTDVGNETVDAILQDRIDRGYETADKLFQAVYEDLDRLQAIPLFSEATDTEVREAVYLACVEHFNTIGLAAV